MSEEGRRVVARNRKVRHEYEVLETLEAGIELKGPEVKSLRAGHVSFQDAFARVERGEAWLHSLHISPYEQANRNNVDPLRARRLLLNRSEIRRLVARGRGGKLPRLPRGPTRRELRPSRGRERHPLRRHRRLRRRSNVVLPRPRRRCLRQSGPLTRACEIERTPG